MGNHDDRRTETESAQNDQAPREAIARNPRRAWPLVVIVGVPVAIAIAFTVASGRSFPGDKLGSVLASVVALPLMLVGSYTLVFPARGRGRAAVFFALAAAALGAGYLRDSFVPGNHRPAGWSSKLPQYPGLVVEAQTCSETEGGATFRTISAGGKGRSPSTVSYERALREAGLPANRFTTTCPALGIDCSSYRAASLDILECYADSTKSIARLRYGTPACPSK